MPDDGAPQEIHADAKKVKRAEIAFYEDRILIECPFCGTTLIRTNYQRIEKLLHLEGTPRAKQCPKCGGLAVLKLSSKGKRIVMDRLVGGD